MKGPHWIKQWIADLAALNDQFRDDCGTIDFEALGREEYAFRTALITRNLAKSERARDIYNIAKAAYNASVENGKKGGRPRKETTADGDTREDSQAKPDGSAITRNETRAHDALNSSANIYGDAATREGTDFVVGREIGVTATTTISRNMRRVPQTEAPAHGFSGGRTAQGTMSRSPEAAAQSGKVYDQETFQVSTDEARQSQALESRRTDGHSLRVGNVARPPVRSPGRKFRNKEEFIQWAIDTGLDPDDAGNCWEATMERGGLTKDGKKVDNLCAYAVKWCRTSKKNRETA